MSFTELKENILACDDCTEAPSNNVHLTKKPFNDPSGAKLKYKWYQITDDVFYNEDHFYITALSHCFPGKNAKGGDNPPPLACARKWLRKELEAVNNELFVIIGSKAAKFLFPNESFDDLVFKNNTLNDKPAIVLPHPSPLNRKWFKDHPLFEEKRLPEIREIIRKVLWEISG